MESGHLDLSTEPALYKTTILSNVPLSLAVFNPRNKFFSFSQRCAIVYIVKEKKKGVIACSAGNHAQGVALAAQKNGIKAVICLPDGAPISKVEATKSYGAEVCLVKGVYDDAYQKALQLLRATDKNSENIWGSEAIETFDALTIDWSYGQVWYF